MKTKSDTTSLGNYDVFISHSTKDKDVANEVCRVLEEHDIRCWIAPRDISPGSEYEDSIMQAIDECRLMVLIFSANSNSSPDVKSEIREMCGRGKGVIPFMLDESEMNRTFKYHIGSTQYLVAYPKYRDKFEELTATVRQMLVVEDTEEEDGVNKISAPEEKQLTSSNKENTLPPSLNLSYKNKTLWFYLAPDKKFYIGNIHAEKKDVSWLSFKFSAGELATLFGGGAALVLAPLWTIGAAVLWFLVSVLFSDDKDKNSPADKRLCNNLSKATEYKFDLPTEKEKEAAVESARPYCIVLRVKDNPNLKELIKTEYTL